MNPLLIILFFIGGGIVWVLCSFLFKPIGRFVKRIIEYVYKTIFED